MLASILKDKVNLIQYIFVMALIFISIPFTVRAFDTIIPNEPKYASFINYYDYPIRVQIGDKSTEIASQESGIIRNIDENQNYTINIYNLEGFLLDTRSHEFDKASGYSIDILSEDNLKKVCLVEVDVENIFYGEVDTIDSIITPTEDPENEVFDFLISFYEIESYSILVDQPTNSFQYNQEFNYNYLLLPGEYNGFKLPEYFNNFVSNIEAIIPIDCELKDDLEEVQDETQNWIVDSL